MSRFHKYSVNNTMLIYMQRPDATLVAGFNKWRDQFERNVKKGEKGIKIIAPTPFKKKIEEQKLDPDTKQPIPEGGSLRLTEDEGLNFVGGEITAYQFKAEQKKDRNTEEVEAESISFAVCAYYGIATGENSFGYIATWSKDKELKELRASLETINKTSSELITDIDRNYAEIMKEREADLTITEPVMQTPTEEALYLVDNAVYLHVQPTDGGWDYSLYDKESKKLLDGGVIETAAIEESPVSSLAGAVRTEVFAIQGMTPTSVVFEDIAILEDLQAAQMPNTAPIESEAPTTETADPIDAIARSVQEEELVQAPDNGYMPDPSMSIEAMNAYGYTDSDMLPLSKERALELFERDVPIYMLYDGNTEAMAFEAEDIVLFSGCFGITREDWDAIKDQIPPMDMETIRQKREQAFLESPGDTYAIYQLKRDDATADLRFMNSEWLNKKGVEPQPENYDLIYTGALYPASSQIETLERLYQTFNIDHPADFTGHSLSVSDIVALKQNLRHRYENGADRSPVYHEGTA